MGRLLSVNVGLPRDVEWRGRTVHTGIWKEPVQGRRRVGRLNVEGDGQGDLGGHGGEQRAVFVYQIESYRYWEQQLGRSKEEQTGFSSRGAGGACRFSQRGGRRRDQEAPGVGARRCRG